MKNKIHPALYYFSLFYFVFVVITDFSYIVTSPSLWVLVIIGVVGFVYGRKYIGK